MAHHQYSTRGASNSDNVNGQSNETNILISSLKASFEKSFNDLKDEIINLKDVIIKNLLDENSTLKSKISTLEKRVEKLEMENNQLGQYGRRNNLEISGIPDEIYGSSLEKTSIEILKSINVDVETSQIEACHRVGKKEKSTGSKKTIIRIVNRKYCLQALLNRKNLKTVDKSKITGLNANSNLFIGENLTPYNSKLSFMCRILKTAKRISNTFTKNGVVHITKTSTEHPTKIFHETDLGDLFPEFKFEGVTNW